ncbi:MAG: YkgJ family cysteine cluster protein [Alphaproteobacteria bacterium]|nr:YkgJ family cysteine cluster protein [Alphaproteobacteria bacterium]
MSDSSEDFDRPISPEHEARALAEEMARRQTGPLEARMFDGVRADRGDSVVPVRLQMEDMFAFRCHKGVKCWNLCCHGADITLTPMDILRLSRRLNLRPREFLARHTVPALHEQSGLPVAKLKMTGADGKGACRFVHASDGCTVYADRPATCRYYPLGYASLKMKDSEGKAEFHFLVKEAHCLGHEEGNLQSVAEFRQEQGIGDYDRVNRGWTDILMKMASWKTLGGPGGKDITPQTKKMFFMVSTDVDGLRDFIFKTKFLDAYDVAEAVIGKLKTDDEMLLMLGFDWMKSVLFNEGTLRLKEDVLRAAIARKREDIGGT